VCCISIKLIFVDDVVHVYSIAQLYILLKAYNELKRFQKNNYYDLVCFFFKKITLNKFLWYDVSCNWFVWYYTELQNGTS